MKARGMLRNGLVAAAFALVWIVNAFAQQPQSAARAPQGSLTGHVIDESSGKGLAFATVQVMRASDSAIVNGALTDDNGWFTVTPLPMGNYSVRFGYVGYADVTKQNVTLSSTNPDVDAGNVALKSTLTLQEVVVTESRGSVTLAADRKIYNVGETAQPGQNANEVLQTLPSISQDGDGALQLRGNGNVTIMIDGRPVNSLGQNANVLEQINAESIERVEVITNPSAKFDPEGVGGIINVVLKKNKQQGVNGSIGATYGYEDKTTGTFNLNARGKKFNATFGAGARYHPVKHAGKMLRTYTTDSVYTLFQTTDVQNIPRGGSLRGGLDWFVNPRNTLSFSALAGMSQGTMDETVHYDFQDESENTFYRYDIENDETTDAMNTDFSLSYKKTFVKKGTELDASVSHLTNDDARNTLSDLVLFDTLLPPGFVSFNPYVQEANSKNRILTRQIDFVTDVKEKWKIETGYKQTFRSIDNDISYNQLNANREPIVDTTTYFNALEYNDYIFALYGTLSRTFNKTSVKAGVRGEEARRSLSIADQTDDFNQRRFDLFPSVFILQQLPHQQEVTLNYSRRINRPSVNTLNPFPSFNDPYSRMVGNPYIEPEFTHAVEAGYQKYFKQSVFSTTLYHRVTTNEISRVRTTVGLVSEVRMVNLNSETESGLEATLKLDPAKWWRQTLSGNAYYQQIDGSNFDASFERGAFTYDAKWNSTFLFTKSTSLQANASYRSRNVAPQGVILPMYWLDLSLRKDLWKQKATLTLGLSDVFDTRRFRVETNTVGVIQNWERKRESRILTAGFTYKFGKQFGQQPRKRGHERSDEFGGGGDE